MSSTLSFQLKNGMVWVRAVVEGHQLSGVLDSDSDETFLDTQTAEHLGLNRQNDQHSPSGIEKTKTESLLFDLGPSKLVASRPSLFPIGKQFPGMAFILGFDALGSMSFTVDYSKNMIDLGTLPKGRRVPFRSGRNVPSTQIIFSGTTIDAVVDTGAPAGLDLPFPWVKFHLPSVEFQEAVERKDLGPKYEALPFQLNEIQIGGTRLSSVKAEAIRRKDNPLDQGDGWATIGNNLLQRFAQLGIDGPGRTCVF